MLIFRLKTCIYTARTEIYAKLLRKSRTDEKTARNLGFVLYIVQSSMTPVKIDR